jgi:hypothetical protein
MDIQALRKMRNNDFSKISNEFEKISNPRSNNTVDDRFWKPDRDKAGNASATIRFLPKTDGDELPWVRVFSHGFQGPSGLWYIENSLTTFDEPDPVSELNSKLWNSTTDDNSPQRKQARDQRRRLSYIANVLIVEDPKHPENNGQVKLFKFGKKIFDKIMDKARPTFEDEEPVNVFDYWEGANFKLRMKQVAGYPNYDTSVFAEPSPISEDEEEILKVANGQHKLSEFLDKSKHFKTYDQLKARLESVLSAEGSVGNAAKMAEESSIEYDAPKESKAPTPKASKPAAGVTEDDDDAMSFFQRIADED